MNNKFSTRCAVIGAGQMGRNHARIYSDIAQLVAVVDVDFPRAQAFTKEFGGTPYKDVEQMLQAQHPDAVSIVVPTGHHFDVAHKTLTANIPTLLEKPIAATVDQACELAAVAKKQKTIFMIGQVERFNPAVQALDRLIKHDELGRIINISATRVGIAPPVTKNSDVSLDLAIHDIDVIVSLLNKVPREVYRVSQQIHTYQKVDAASLLLSFDDASAVITTNWITPIKIRTLQVTGTKGYAVLDYVNQTVVIYDRKVLEKPDTFSQLVDISNPKARPLTVTKKEPLREELQYFLSQKKWSKELELQVDRAIRALEILLQ